MFRSVFAAALISLSVRTTCAQMPVEINAEAPELEVRPKSEWINSKPLQLAELRGQVAVLHFWTLGCINCIHNQPHYESSHRKYAEKGVGETEASSRYFPAESFTGPRFRHQYAVPPSEVAAISSLPS